MVVNIEERHSYSMRIERLTRDLIKFTEFANIITGDENGIGNGLNMKTESLENEEEK
jgi:hypothetical protein